MASSGAATSGASSAADLTVDPAGMTVITAENGQDALEQVDAKLVEHDAAIAGAWGDAVLLDSDPTITEGASLVTADAAGTITVDLSDNEEADLRVTQDATGGRAVTWAGVDVWHTATAAAPDTSGRAANATDRFFFEAIGGTTYGYWLTESIGNALEAYRRVVVKAVDETVNNSVTLQNDDELLFAVAANETAIFEFVLYVTSGASGATADFRCALTVPAGATFRAQANGPGSASTTMEAANRTESHLSVSGTAGKQIGLVSSETVCVRVRGVIQNGGTAGNVTLQWAQWSATVTDVTIENLSHVVVDRVP